MDYTVFIYDGDTLIFKGETISYYYVELICKKFLGYRVCVSKREKVTEEFYNDVMGDL